MSLRTQAVQQIFTFAPAQRDYLSASRIMFSVGIPVGILAVLARTDLTIFAAFGAFTAVYGRNEPPRIRLRHQSQAAAMLCAALLVGILLSALGSNPWWVIPVCSLVGAAGAIGSIYCNLRPPGALFYVFACGAIGSISYNGAPLLSLAIALASAGLSVLLGLIGALLGEGTRGPIAQPLPHHGMTTSQVLTRGAIYGGAALVAGSIGELVGLSHAYWAMVAAVAVITGSNTLARVTRGIQRTVGTVGGVLITAFFVSMQPDLWHVVVLVVVSQFLAELFVLRNYGFAMLFITPLALFMIYLVQPFTSYEVLTTRMLETAIGATVGMVAVVITPAQELVGKDTVTIPVMRAARSWRERG